MPSIFSRLKGQKSNKQKKGPQTDQIHQQPPKPRWEDAWTRTWVEPEEIHELIKRCTEEIKARALDHPFLLLPFRPTSDPSAVRTFVRHFFDNNGLRGQVLAQEIRMTEPMVIAGALKWCWSRLQGGVVGWDAYELFKVGEQDSNMARDSFKTFIPLSIENGARTSIIFNFFDLLSAIAAHGKMNGFGGRKLSRMAAWWAFEQKDASSGFDDGYKQWLKAADATSHLFFAYLRTLAPQQQSRGGIAMLPNSLQKLLQETEYPPRRPSLMQSSTNKVVMIVDTVSPTPFALLRRGNHFQYRDSDSALQHFSEYEDPVSALTEECRRVLRAISAANQTQAVSSSKHSTSLRDASWSRFEDIGFASALDEEEEEEAPQSPRQMQGIRTTPASGMNLGRPTTPSWADFLSSGFVDDGSNGATHLLPPDKQLPPIDTAVRQKSSQSHRPRLETEHRVEAGELASITKFSLDDAFWWVWMASLAPEETPARKSAFGRCAVIETVIRSGRWLVMEEVVKGAAPEIEEGAYVAEKKGFFSWTRRNKDKGVSRSKSTAGRNALGSPGDVRSNSTAGFSKTSIGPDQQAKISAAARQLQARQEREKAQAANNPHSGVRRGRTDADLMAEKTNSVMTLRPMIMSEASPAMKWANKYDKEAIREAYLANQQAGRGIGQSTMQTNGHNGSNGYGLPESPSSMLPPPSPAVPPKDTPLPFSGHDSPMPPPMDAPNVELNRETTREPTPMSVELPREQSVMSPEPVGHLSPEAKKNQKKLHKEAQKEKEKQKAMEKAREKEMKKAGGGGFKLFGRGRRASKLPENTTTDLNAMLAQREAAATPDPAHHEKPDMPRQETQFATPREEPTDPMPQNEPSYEPQYEPSVHDDASRVDTADANEAHHEFSRFDQGPLDDQPAFIPQEESEEEDFAVPPPIPRHKSPSLPEEETDTTPPLEEAKPLSGPDRWAQIRKNAADRAAQRQSEEQSRGGHRKTTDGEDDTSGEETIESRVARIKARVAELTGNMEGVNGPPGSVAVRR